MNHVRLKLIAAGGVIAAAVTVLALSGIREGWVYYLPVDQFLEDASYHGQRVRLHGLVATANLEVKPAMLIARFELEGESRRLPVQYEGVIPDQFKGGREVVVEGQLEQGGVFHADTLLTKCASKYETDEGQAPHAGPSPGNGRS